MVCPFCERRDRKNIAESGDAVAFSDNFPISKGHSLVVPRRHCPSIFELNEVEFSEIWKLVGEVRMLLVKSFNPAGFNIGVNDGAAAGQTIAHAHIHVIPRFVGDVPDPKGGIRWILPGRAKYWQDD